MTTTKDSTGERSGRRQSVCVHGAIQLGRIRTPILIDVNNNQLRKASSCMLGRSSGDRPRPSDSSGCSSSAPAGYASQRGRAPAPGGTPAAAPAVERGGATRAADPAPSRPAPRPPAAPPPPAPRRVYTLQSDRPIAVFTTSTLSTKTNQSGEKFTATLAEPIVDGDWVVARTGRASRASSSTPIRVNA